MPTGQGLAVKVAMWAEICRLAEIEKTVQPGHWRRLHCSCNCHCRAQTGPASLVCELVRGASLLDGHRSKIDALLAKYP